MGQPVNFGEGKGATARAAKPTKLAMSVGMKAEPIRGAASCNRQRNMIM